MNIDSSNILSLLSPSSDLENIQQALGADSSIPQEFADTLMDKINRLSGVVSGMNDETTNNFLGISGSDNKLHGFAGLLNENGTASELSRLFGNGLPNGNKLENDIDLENTLEALSSVIESLESDVTDRVELDKKLESLLEKVEAIKMDLPTDSELPEKLNEAVDILKTIRQFLAAGDESQENSEINSFSPENELPKQVELNVSDEGVNKLRNTNYNKQAEYDVSISDEESSVGVALKNNGLSKDVDRPFSGQDANQLAQSNEFVVKEQLQGVNEDRVPAAKESRPIDIDRSDSTQGASQFARNNEFVAKEQLQGVNEDTTPAEKESRLPHGVEIDQSEKNNQNQDTAAYLQQQLDKVVDVVEQIKELVSIDNEQLSAQINSLKTDVTVLRENVFQLIADKAASQNIKPAFRIETENESGILLERQIAALALNLVKAKEPEKAYFAPVVQEIIVDTKKENIPLKQTTEERVLGLPSREGVESLIQQENALRKPGQGNPVMTAKQAEKIEILNSKEPEQIVDKTLPRFAADIANLNRAILVDNKQETLPPMTKHFVHPEWNKEMSERVIWMHKQAIPSAELRLNPGHLGPITIKIDVTKDQATVAFTAQHAAVKEAIEAALPKLREMFSAQQLNLTSVDVSQDEHSQRQPRGFSQMGSHADKEGNRENNEMAADDQSNNVLDISDEIEAGRAIASNGLLSVFA